MVDIPPKVFLCHAGEDKDFATRLGTRLRENGVDAFVDKWEILAGDKLIQKIFGEGIPQARALIVILSRKSVTKPWVQEELDAGLILRIEKRMKIIPIRIDDVEVPVALKATAWLDMSPSADFESQFKKLLQAIFEVRERPPLGPPPGFVARPQTTNLDPYEEAILRLVLEKTYRGKLSGEMSHLDGKEIQEALPEMSPEQINDAVEILKGRGILEVTNYMGTAPFHFGMVRPTDHGFFSYAPAILGIDTQRDYDEILAFAVSWNRPGEMITGERIADALRIDPERINHAVALLEARGLVKRWKGAGTAPYMFHGIEATAQGRKRARR